MDKPKLDLQARLFVGAVSLYAVTAFLTHSACAPARPAPLVLSPVAHDETLSDVRERPDAGVRLGIPLRPEPFQKTPPCDPDLDEQEIRGACYQRTGRAPPCGKLREHDGRCYRPIAKTERKPTSITQ